MVKPGVFLPGLRVRIKELAQEAVFIRIEERRAKARKSWEEHARLHDHRVNAVRPAARSAQLAYAYLRGIPYRAVERSAKTTPDWKEVQRLVRKFSQVSGDDLAEWAV